MEGQENLGPIRSPRRDDADSLRRFIAQRDTRASLFAVLRVVEAMGRQECDPAGSSHPPLIGTDTPLRDELVRLKGTLSGSYPQNDIDRMAISGSKAVGLHTSFCGMTGPAGKLPEALMDKVVRDQRDGEGAIRDFLDLFHHRLLSLHYRAWAKHRLDVNIELGLRGVDDSVSRVVAALAGLSPSSAQKLSFRQRGQILHPGALLGRPTQARLEVLFSKIANRPVRLLVLEGSWARIRKKERTALGAPFRGNWNRLGKNAVIGSRFWNPQQRITLSLGPVDWSELEDLSPGGGRHKQFRSVCDTMIGLSTQRQLSISVRERDIKPVRLGGGVHKLGWNSFLGSSAPSDRQRQIRIPMGPPIVDES